MANENEIKITTLADDGHCLLNPAQVLPATVDGLDEARRIITGLRKSLLPRMPAAGLAAPQIGISKQVFIFSWDRSAEHLEAAINPSFAPIDEEKIAGYEGCFSVPLALAQVPRYQNILARYTNAHGKRVTYQLQGFAARVFQHEYDHLQGIENIHRQDAEVKVFKSEQEMTSFIQEVKRSNIVNYVEPIEIHYQIIYLNGPSSSGKSTLAKALQDTFALPFLHVGIDKLIGMMPNKMNNWEGGYSPDGFSWKKSVDKSGAPIQEIQAGPFAKKIVRTLREFVSTLAQAGHFIIIDDVSFGEAEVSLWREALKEYKVLWVGLSTELPHLEAREKSRGDRIIGSARDQHFRVHEGVNYDLEFDSSWESPTSMVSRILSVYYSTL